MRTTSPLFTNKFVSPLSSLGPSFYKYYLMDTLTVAGKPCVDLTFVPFNSESFGFTGHLYVMLDSTYFVKRTVMNFPQKINLNFVDYMKIEQNFDRAEDGTRQLLNESTLRSSSWWTIVTVFMPSGMCITEIISMNRMTRLCRLSENRKGD